MSNNSTKAASPRTQSRRSDQYDPLVWECSPKNVRKTIPTVSASVTATARPHIHHSRFSICRIRSRDFRSLRGEAVWKMGGIGWRYDLSPQNLLPKLQRSLELWFCSVFVTKSN